MAVNYLTGVKHFSPLGTQNIGYTYGDVNQGQMPDRVYKVSWNGQEKLNFVYDPLGRLTSKIILVGGGVSDAPHTLDTQYTYFDVGTDKTTTLLKSLQTPAGTYNYTYDAVGNITSVQSVDDRYHYSFDYTSSFAYDDLNQLVRENNPQLGKTYTYSYVNGNITERKEYAYTTGELGEVLDTRTWSYTDNSWSDLLTSYNGISISYDEIGNPTAIGSQSLSWNGRQLQKIVDGTNTYSYAYNTDGQRISKTVNGVTTEYFYNGSILAGQKTGDDTLVFMYDNNGDPFGFVYNDETYYYVKNVQNDVFGITDHNRVLLVNYAYDAWGKVVSVTDADGNEITDMSHIGHINPIRYRSYYYDGETNLYYLNSRYYSPDICRFLNADGYVQTGQGMLDKNMFAYCLNNPVMREDANGDLSIGFIIALAIIGMGAIVGGVLGGMSSESLLDKSTNAKNEEVNDAYLPKPPVLNNNSSNESGKNSSNNNPSSSNRELSRSDRVKNIAIGATLGMAAGGAVVAVTGIVIGGLPVLGAPWALCTAGAQMFMTGALAFNLEVMIIGPFFSVDLEPIEWEVREER